MNKQETLEVELAQNLKCQEKLKEGMAEIEAKIKALAEPELRHGDYGYDDKKRPQLLCNETLQNNKNLGTFEDGSWNLAGSKHNHVLKTKTGNIFDDLKRNSEDLERTDFISNRDGDTINANLNPNSIDIYVDRCGSKMCILPFDKATEFHQQLGQLIATAERRSHD